MNAVTSDPSPLGDAPLWPLSVAAYHLLGESGLIPHHTELLYGLVYTKIPKPPLHSFLVVRLMRLLHAVLPPDFLARSEQPITCPESEPEPDISVVRGTEIDFLTDHPHTAELVVEVCVNSYEYGRSKLRAYAAAAVKECWLVLGPEQQIEVYRRPKDGQFTEYAVFGPGGALASTALLQFNHFTLSLDSLFTR